uniref:hypothetical protein n=1 Tax=Candidatus Methylacidiphilum fumarolicum TaxID=591154 RepID=UPI000AB13E9D|nr:hypothetical protein [Candidatus Methylacidiphilum fumarolicum]
MRFGAELMFATSKAKNVEVVLLNQDKETTFEEDWTKDILEIITGFSVRLYGSRLCKNQKLLDGVKKAVEEFQAGSSSTQSRWTQTIFRPPTLPRLRGLRGSPTSRRLSSGRDYIRGGKPRTCLPKRSQPSFYRQLNAMKHEEFPCMLEVTKNAPQMAIRQLGAACKNFWEVRA